MNELAFILIGIGTGSLYAMVAQGLVLVYRGSGIVNFAQGAFVMFGAYAYYNLYEHAGLSLGAALVVSVCFTALLGVAVQTLILRPMRHSSALARLIATLGVLVTLQATAVIIYGDRNFLITSLLPTNSVEVLPNANIGADRLIIFTLGVVLTTVLWAIYRFTSFGRLTSAVAQNPRTAASMGHSPDLIAAANWGVGGAIAGLAGVLIGPITSLEPINLPLIVLPALAAALIGSFASFPMAFAAALLIGVVESLMALHVKDPGWAQSVPFLVVIIVLIVRGRGLPLRSYLLDRLPSVGAGRVRVVPVMVFASLVAAFMVFGASDEVATYLTVTVTMSIMCLSVVVVTGYAGQISLAQYVLGGVGAFAAAKTVSSFGLPFLLSIVVAAVVALVVGGIVGVPALRSRGINLAIVGLGLAVALYNLVLNNGKYSGGVDGIPIDAPSIFGWSVDPFLHPTRYGLVCVVASFLVALMVANLRRGQVGRRLLAVRSSERAAASLGVNVYWCKLYAFMLASAIAAIGGSLFAFMQSVVLTSQFGVMSSINLVAVTVVGGVGSIPGAFVGATFVTGGIGTWLLNLIGLHVWLPLIGGLTVLYVLRSDQGLADMNIEGYRVLRSKLSRRREAKDADLAVPHVRRPARSDTGVSLRVPAQELKVEGVSVRFGGVQALDGVSLTVRPGTVHGVIGPNGAGKTTLVDALTGFADVSAGHVRLNGSDLNGASPMRRSRAGLRRSFQSMELFSNLTARDNIAVGCDEGRRRKYLTDLVRPGPIALSEAAEVAIEKFQLESMLDVPVESLPFGDRRLVAIARTVASAPSVILLDEPAAGLGSAESNELAELVRSLADVWGIAVVLVEHNIDLVLSVSDEVTVLAEGRVLAHGSPHEIRQDSAVIEAYLGVDAESADTVAVVTR
ncbi:branched-chain amino acid ABC transporter permease/ATP-binding protein [Aeromicrobium panaciterrae]|uniref:branched-chain amino acid ABC transporter permease/ATP-binding protein n=1 Tax=Aeromicrobium panaciterrae TaxID=363861 RepID=UPI0031DC0B6D